MSAITSTLANATYAQKVQAIRALMPGNVLAVEAFCLAHKGQYISITYRRECKTLKGVLSAIEKETVSVFRIGIEYESIQRAKDAHESGAVAVEGLDDGNYKLSSILYYSENTGKYRLAIAPTFNDGIKTVSRFFRDGVEVEKATLFNSLAASEMTAEEMAKAGRKCNRIEKESETLLLTFNPENIIAFGKSN